ncbi:hypothetical protein DM02DRAFT_70543 [Periconia macrospinosa]|uniref:DUF6594 domain-containing protein n=1 Tax=Periconia macrospinosa TaxID=97972 RepID=A0A2V1E911_9PLEO|nr:hypothetical protein DM02DRAFT_70543 [Periconia macrospinosa]
MDNDAKDGKPRKLVLSVAALSRMRLRKLQCRLARNIIYMQTHDKEPDDWEENLSKYVAAIRDNDFIVAAVDRSEDPFIIHSGRAVDAEVLKLALQNRLDSQDDWKDVDFGQAADHDKPLPIGGGTRRQVKAKEKLQNFFARLTLGVIGGAFLVGPMWLMVLHDTKITKLVSTTVFVFAFGILMSWRLNDSFGVLSATAAYAAVLVVFVGANN